MVKIWFSILVRVIIMFFWLYKFFCVGLVPTNCKQMLLVPNSSLLGHVGVIILGNVGG
jgi:uncharacterized membrane-anchored protein